MVAAYNRSRLVRLLSFHCNKSAQEDEFLRRGNFARWFYNPRFYPGQYGEEEEEGAM